MTKYLLAAACLALASCAAQKALPQYTEAEQAAQRGGISYWQPDPTPADSTPLLHRPPVWTPADSLRWALHKQAHQVDSIVVERTPTFLDKVLHRTPKPYTVAVTPARIGKKSTVNVYLGQTTVTTAGKKAQVAAGAGAAVVVAEKKAGPVVLADSGAKVQVATAKKGQAAAGEGISQTQPAEPSLLEKAMALAVPVGVVALILFLTSGGPAWLLGLVRRRKPDNQA